MALRPLRDGGRVAAATQARIRSPGSALPAYAPGMEGRRQKNLVLILAREFASKLATATFLIDRDGRLVYFNEPAEAILGRTFAEAGELRADEWAAVFEVERLDGTPLELDSMPAGIALLERRPAHDSFRITGFDGHPRAISVTALPLLASAAELVGVMAIFWELGEGS